MIKVTLSESALLRTRIAPHAAWEIMASIAVLAHSGRLPQFPYRGWVRGSMAALSKGRGAQLVRWARSWPGSEVPRFLLPDPRCGGSSLRDAQRELREYPPELLLDRLKAAYPAGAPEAFRVFCADPRRALTEFNDAVDAYVAAVLRPGWPAIWGITEEEVLFRAQILATEGVDALLGRLHARIRWTRPTMTIATRNDRVDGTEASQMILVPLLFLRDQVLLDVSDDGAVYVGYQARGAANLAMRLDGLPSRQADRLALLLGKTRTSVLRLLATPATTTELAESLGLAASTVSEHLTLLVSSGVISRRRRGNRVYYALSEQGVELLRSVDQRTEA